MTMLDRELRIDAAALKRWRSNPVRFIEEVFIDYETGKPYRLLPSEREFLKHAFRTDASGRLLYPEQLYGAPKKSGKTAFAAMHTLTTVLLFGGPFPEAYALANDYEQAASRVFEAIKKIVECSPLLRAEARITQGRIAFPTVGAVIQAIGSDYASAAGANPNISVFDELWAYVSERSRRLWDEMIPPPTRKTALRLTCTYAGFSGESALLEELHARGLKQPLIGTDLYAGDGILMFWSHVPIAPWQSDEWITSMRRSLRPNQYLRMIENRFVTTESTFIDMDWWDACVDAGAAPAVSNKSLSVWLGVDASVKRDSTAVVACAWDNKINKVRLVWHRVFQPSAADPLDFEKTVEWTIGELAQRFHVREVRYDPFQMASTTARLVARGIPMVEFPQTVPNLTESSQNLYELVKGGNIVVYPDDAMRLAIQRSIAIETSRGWRIAKEKQSHKIDVVVALAMAALGAVKGGVAGSWFDPVTVSKIMQRSAALAMATRARSMY